MSEQYLGSWVIEKKSRVNALQVKLLKGGPLPVKIPGGIGQIPNWKYLAFELKLTGNMDLEGEREFQTCRKLRHYALVFATCELG